MKTYLVTWGAGFIGSNFILMQRRQTPIRIVNLDRLTYAGNPKNLESLQNDSNYIFIRGDIEDRSLVRDLLTEYRLFSVYVYVTRSSGGSLFR